MAAIKPFLSRNATGEALFLRLPLHAVRQGTDLAEILILRGGGGDELQDGFRGETLVGQEDGEDGAGIFLVLRNEGKKGFFRGFVVSLLIAGMGCPDVLQLLDEGLVRVIERGADGPAVFESDGSLFEVTVAVRGWTSPSETSWMVWVSSGSLAAARSPLIVNFCMRWQPVRMQAAARR